MYCINCGKEVIGEAKYCACCSVHVGRTVIKRKISQYIWLVLGVFGVLVVGVVGIVAASRSDYSAKGESVDTVVSLESEKEEREINKDKEESANGSVVENIEDVEEQKISVWHDGVEFKILEYLDDELMRVKFVLEKYIVQAVVPRTLEQQDYFVEEYSDYDAASGEEETYLKVINQDKGDALYFAYGRGAQVIENFANTYEMWKSRGESEDCYQIETVCNGEGLVVVTSDSVAWSRYDKDERLLQGYMTAVSDEEEAAVFMFGLLTDDEGQYDMIRDSVEQVVIRRITEDDLVLKMQVDDEYEQRMTDMFQKYREITDSPTEYLQTNYYAPGSEYNYHYLYDVTGDGVPEIFFQGNPSLFCIVGEANAVCLHGVDEIVWTDMENIFYTKSTSQAGINWDRYEVSIDMLGYMEINRVASIAIDHEGNYSMNGETITREKYLDVISIVEQNYLPEPRRVYSKEYVLSKKGFKDSVKRLTDEFLYK